MAEYIVQADNLEALENGFYSIGNSGEPLVRCKDCKHNSLKRVSGNAFCELGHTFSQLYDYCSDGERRTRNKNGM